MADIRINALANTATTPASDDYLALDGTAQGTRKILATNIANNVTDVILGSSGPSVKSSLSARAPRQGLVQSGTTGSTFANTAVIGLGAFTYSLWIYQPTAGTADLISGQGSAPGLYVSNVGALGINKVYASVGPQTSAGAYTAGKWAHIVYSRTSTATNGAAYYVNGILVATVTDALDYTVAPTSIGKRGDDTQIFTGTIATPLVYNRALSASEVVALYESGAPSGADYGLIGQPASNTSIITGDSSTFTGGVGNWTGFNGGSISAVGGKGVISMASYHQGASNNTNQMVAGRRYRLTVTVSALAGGSYVLLTDYNSVEYASLTAGVNVVEFISRSNTGIAFKQGNSGTTSASVDDISLLPIGLLLAPDAAQAGGGLVWYDTSGNAANITLPASGVSWNVPFAGYVTAPTTTNLTLAGGSSGASLVLGQGTNGTFTFTLPSISAGNTTWVSAGAVGIGIDFKRATAAATLGVTLASLNGYNGATRAAIFEFNGDGATDSGRFDWWVKPTAGSLTQAMVLKSTGNLLIGTTTDVAAYKLNVYGATSANVIAANGVTPDGTKTGGVFATALGGTGGATGSYALTGDIAGRFVMNAYGNNFIYEAASMQAEITTGGNTDRNLHVAALDFYTKPTGSNTLTRNMRLTGTGNLLIGTTTDGGNGKLQLATHTTSAGGIGFGTDVSLYRESSSILNFATATHNYLKLTSSVADRQQIIQFVQSGNSASFGFEGGTRGNYVGTTINGYEVLKIYGSTGTALTLDSSQNATFAGDVLVQKSTPLLRLNNTGSGAGNWVHTITAATGEYRIGEYGIGDYIIINKTSGQIDFYKLFRPQQAATASAPTYVKGAIYFDTTLNKLRVGGATGWETITST